MYSMYYAVVLLATTAVAYRERKVFHDDFNSFNASNYQVEVSAWGGGNHEFQIYTNDRANVFTKNGYLYLKPTFSTDNRHFSENTLYHGRINLYDIFGTCTNSANYGCDRTAVNGEILNPVLSGKITSHAAIRYGRVTVRAKIPRGDWLWPAIWMLPRDNHYGGWPRSGEIDMMESIGNVRAMDGGTNKGVNQVASTLHWGPDYNHNAYYKTHREKRKNSGDFHGFHNYVLEWDANHIRTLVDNEEILNVPTPGNSFWGYGGFHGNNVWASGGRNAPFDQPFHLLLNVAVGGDYFSDNWQYDNHKPWHKNQGQSMRKFWEARGSWQGTWGGDDDRSLVVDYVDMVEYI